VLSYDGTHPVNLIHFLAVFVAVQVVLLALWVRGDDSGGAGARGHRAYAPVHELIRELVYRASAIGPRARRLSGRMAPLLGRLGVLGTVYGAAERWRIMVAHATYGILLQRRLRSSRACISSRSPTWRSRGARR
jgi:hypothetical protein